MGWVAYAGPENTHECQITEAMILEQADYLIKTGLKSVGYEYVILDDCWASKERDKNEGIQADALRFPSGMQKLGSLLHSMGFKFGLSTSVGIKSCTGMIGSKGHEEQDAAQFASWGVDYLKDDFCLGPHLWLPSWNYKQHYKQMSEALHKTNRPIFFSLSNWGFERAWEWAPKIADSWRTSLYLKADWKRLLQVLDSQIGKEKFASPGHWNDPDYLQVGLQGLSAIESQSHFSLWAMLSAPLMIVADLRQIGTEDLGLLKAPEVIAINQDPAGLQGYLLSEKKEGLQIWVKKLSPTRAAASNHLETRYAIAFFNRLETNETISLQWEELGIDPQSFAEVRNLWLRQTVGSFQSGWASEVPAHGLVLFTAQLGSGS